ncbi:cytochrome c-type biogenesis protein [Zavarzinia sp. CC-PAN008]|uniref:cytochrome c-type biogenesis protein n=1 Tax=Zavarzinia sp. CC-PAN008 TaxID=3243332 RepID=UPI003F74942A
MRRILSTPLRAMALAIVLCLGLAHMAHAVAVDPPLPDPALEARARAISKGLRCLVCQNQSIEDSNADLARDLRNLVRQRVAAGDSDEQALAFVVARYGDWVLMEPPLKPRTYALWALPGVLLVLGAGLVLIFYRRRKVEAAPAPLAPDERRRLKALLDEGNS